MEVKTTRKCPTKTPCLQIYTGFSFPRYDANMLFVEAHFGTANALQPQRIVKSADGGELMVELNKWVVWSREHREYRNGSFGFLISRYSPAIHKYEAV